ncbi:uncharacterized protein CTRU02_213060 [Colletotrichum truncatum]|uniref:Uncharacterized protein n=1 Tax=Colletotrichum truncatum TaxID=5467 RepID=A0ACC3YJV7_COLTU|nr:uncharacterized protein CTRU02_03382 [Colletotrichum truncatum]KAF6797351.1 hypothetical protein CTRU02_03382 [Colletotrichum truncatum]
MAGTLVPPWYEEHPPSVNDMNIASMFWGFTLGVGLWSGVKGYRQTMASWRRIHRINAYVWFIWAEWLASMVIGIVSWCYLTGKLETSFEYFFFLLVLWTIQVQCLMQIIINRIAILMPIPSHATRLKWGVFIILLAVNISVFCIWIPARLQISHTYVHINEIWDRIEKGIFLIVDASLNLTFIYLVKSRLIASGLTKYTRLFRFNLCMIAVSMSLDVILIALMSLPNTLIYAQFHPLAYLLKLHIEMGMADLIAKVVRESHSMNAHLESRRNSNDVAPNSNQNKSLSRSTGSKSRRFSLPYLGGRLASSPLDSPSKTISGGEEPRSSQHENTAPERAVPNEVFNRPWLLSRRSTAPIGLSRLETTPQSDTSQPGSGSTVVDHEAADYV